jgi:hypothetical protein
MANGKWQMANGKWQKVRRPSRRLRSTQLIATR